MNVPAIAPVQSLKKNKGKTGMVFRLHYESPDEFSYAADKMLDGDLSKVTMIDTSQDDGLTIIPSDMVSGRCIDSTHLPSRMQLGGPKRNLPDIYFASGKFVDEKFKAIVEQFEPNVHQFFPVEFVWKDGSHAYNRYWFIPCNRLDTVSREKTTNEFRGGVIWMPLEGGEYVFSKQRIGNHHVWIDKRMPSIMGLLMTNELKDALEAAGVTGMGWNEYKDTDLP